MASHTPKKPEKWCIENDILLMFVDLRGAAMWWSRYVKLCQNPTASMVRWSGPKSFAGISKRYHAEMEQNPQILIETKHLCIFRSELLDAENPFARNSESNRTVSRRYAPLAPFTWTSSGSRPRRNWRQRELLLKPCEDRWSTLVKLSINLEVL